MMGKMTNIYYHIRMNIRMKSYAKKTVISKASFSSPLWVWTYSPNAAVYLELETESLLLF